MKRRITSLLLGDQIYYTVKKKKHWWNSWQYIYDGQYPRLFKLEDLIRLHIISIEELDKYFKLDGPAVVNL